MYTEKKPGKGLAVLALLLALIALLSSALFVYIYWEKGILAWQREMLTSGGVALLTFIAAAFALAAANTPRLRPAAVMLSSLSVLFAAALLVIYFQRFPPRYLARRWTYILFAEVPVRSLRARIPALNTQGQEIACLIAAILSGASAFSKRPAAEPGRAASPVAPTAPTAPAAPQAPTPVAPASPVPVPPSAPVPDPAAQIAAVYRDLQALREQREALGEAEYNARLLRHMAALRDLGALTPEEFARNKAQLTRESDETPL